MSRPSKAATAPSEPGRARRRYTSEFRTEAVTVMRQRRAEGVSLAQIGRELGIRPNMLWYWAKQLDGGGTGPAAPAGETLEEENRRLRRENAILRQEREFAKKAAAFFLKESL